MPTVFITGSTDGSASQRPNRFSRDGHWVVLHARSAERAAVTATLASRSAGLVVATPKGHAGVIAANTFAPYILTALINCPARLDYLSSGLHGDGEGSLEDFDGTGVLGTQRESAPKASYTSLRSLLS